jgi:hypothetical protein
VIRYTDYFDSPSSDTNPFQQFIFNLATSPWFGSTTGGDDSDQITKVLRVEVFALPKWAVATTVSGSSVMVLFGVPARVGPGTGDSKILNTSQRSTLLTPTANTKWVRVGGWEHDKLFGDSEVLPAFTSDAEGNPLRNQVLASLLLVDPDDMGTFLAGNVPQVQYRIEWTVAHSMPAVTQANYVLTSLDTVDWAGVIDIQPDNKPVVAEVLQMRDVV